MTRTVRRFAICLLILALLTPIGLWLPELFKAGAAWGEWGSDGLKQTLGYVPKGLQALENIWAKAIFPGYGVSGWTSPVLSTIGYVLSALLGIASVAGIGYLLGKILAFRERGSEKPQSPRLERQKGDPQ